VTDLDSRLSHESNALSQTSDPSAAAPAKLLLDLLAQVTVMTARLRQRFELPHAEQALLEILDRCGPMTVPQIARTRSTSRQNIQILVDRLEAVGRIELAGNPAHKKSALVRLTESGKKALDAAEGAQNGVLLELGSHLSEAEVQEAVSVLTKVQTVLSASGRVMAIDRRDSVRKSAGRRRNPPKLNSEGTDPQTAEFPINLL
jgi:DNA-binding MarR family transcriptional regulator